MKLSLIALYLKFDLDYLIAARTPPYHSWRNPVERAMSLLNLWLQCVSMMRGEGSELFEREMVQCGNKKRQETKERNLRVITGLCRASFIVSDISETKTKGEKYNLCLPCYRH